MMRRVQWKQLWAVVAVVAGGWQSGVQAQEVSFPQRPVKVVVANGAGSAPDILARQLSQVVGTAWQQPLVIENKGAAGGVSAIDAVIKSAADGHALLVAGDSAITIMPHVQSRLPYDVRHDLVPVTKLGQSDFVIVAAPSRGFQQLADLVTAGKNAAEHVSYASSGTGGAQHLAMEQFKLRAGFEATHVAYRGGPQGLQDVLSGQVDVMMVALTPALPHIRSGKLTALAVTGGQRHTLLPEVPTVSESYPGFEAGAWFGLFAPKGTPAKVVQQIARQFDAALQAPALAQQLQRQGLTPVGNGPQTFAQQVQTEDVRVAKLVQEIGLTVE